LPEVDIMQLQKSKKQLLLRSLSRLNKEKQLLQHQPSLKEGRQLLQLQPSLKEGRQLLQHRHNLKDKQQQKLLLLKNVPITWFSWPYAIDGKTFAMEVIS